MWDAAALLIPSTTESGGTPSRPLRNMSISAFSKLSVPASAVPGCDLIHHPQQVTDGLGSRNVLRYLDAEPVLEFEQQFEEHERIDLEFLEQGLGRHSSGIDVFALVQEFAEDSQVVLFHGSIHFAIRP